MRGKSVLLIIGGGIAAYKALELVRRLHERGVRVRAILTRAGAQFVTPLSVSALTGEKTYQDLFSLTDEAEMGHIQLSRSADLVVVAPATADLMAKLAQGIASAIRRGSHLRVRPVARMGPDRHLVGAALLKIAIQEVCGRVVVLGPPMPIAARLHVRMPGEELD